MRPGAVAGSTRQHSLQVRFAGTLGASAATRAAPVSCEVSSATLGVPDPHADAMPEVQMGETKRQQTSQKEAAGNIT